MLVTNQHSNETLVLLQRAANAGSASMWAMRSEATTAPSGAPTAPARRVVRLQAELTAMRVELATVRTERDQLRGVLADLLAEQVQLRTQLAQTQAQLAAVEAERQATRQELVDLKCAPFVARQRQPDDAAPAKRAPPPRPGLTTPRPSRRATPARSVARRSRGRARHANAWSRISTWCARPW
jgi:septal ring factor EnvC (AmiA/AmiB activator)